MTDADTDDGIYPWNCDSLGLFARCEVRIDGHWYAAKRGLFDFHVYIDGREFRTGPHLRAEAWRPVPTERDSAGDCPDIDDSDPIAYTGRHDCGEEEP